MGLSPLDRSCPKLTGPPMAAVPLSILLLLLLVVRRMMLTMDDDGVDDGGWGGGVIIIAYPLEPEPK